MARLRTTWEGLAPRERVLVAGAGAGLLILVLVFGLVSPIMGATERAVERADAAERELALMHRMKRDWDRLHGRLDTVETRIKGAPRGQNLLTLLESLARRAGVQPSSMEKRQSGESDAYEETKVEVSLKNVTLAQAVSYLSSIESESQPLSVKSLRIKRRAAGRRGADTGADLLDVTFSVSAFKPL